MSTELFVLGVTTKRFIYLGLLFLQLYLIRSPFPHPRALCISAIFFYTAPRNVVLGSLLGVRRLLPGHSPSTCASPPLLVPSTCAFLPLLFIPTRVLPPPLSLLTRVLPPPVSRATFSPPFSSPPPLRLPSRLILLPPRRILFACRLLPDFFCSCSPFPFSFPFLFARPSVLKPLEYKSRRFLNLPTRYQNWDITDLAQPQGNRRIANPRLLCTLHLH